MAEDEKVESYEGAMASFVLYQRQMLDQILQNTEALIRLQADPEEAATSVQMRPKLTTASGLTASDVGKSSQIKFLAARAPPQTLPQSKTSAKDLQSSPRVASDFTAGWINFVEGSGDTPLWNHEASQVSSKKGQRGGERVALFIDPVEGESDASPSEGRMDARKSLSSATGWTRLKAPQMVVALEKAIGLHSQTGLEIEEDVAKCVGVVVSGTAFQLLTSLLIVVHILYIGYEVETSIHCARSGDSEPGWFIVGDLVFGVLFTAELLVRVNVERWAFLTGPDKGWNLFDTLVLSLQAFDSFTAFFDLGFLRVVRILRVLRATRVLRTITWLTQLRVMVVSVISTLMSLFWAAVLLLLFLYLVAIGILQIVEYHVREDPEITYQSEDFAGDLFDYYGSLGAALLTLFLSISGGRDWHEFVTPLMAFSEAYVLVFVFYIAFMMFGVMNVFTAIFVENASQISQVDQEVAIQDQLRKDRTTIERIKAMFKKADRDNSGLITIDELEDFLKEDQYVYAFRLLGVDVSEARGLFQLLDIDGNECVSIDEFVTGMMRLKGNAKGIDMATLIYENKRLYAHVQEALEKMTKSITESEMLLGGSGRSSRSTIVKALRESPSERIDGRPTSRRNPASQGPSASRQTGSVAVVSFQEEVATADESQDEV